ncbi:MAG: glycosyltransferase family 2 protein [bacterium]|nr:glycosyltransferase family 2 protein [bacterium]
MNENLCNKFKKISIVVPIFNEEKTISEIIRKIETADACGLEKEIILVDDASTDKTVGILNNYVGKHKVILNKINQGKGATLKNGFRNVTGDVIIIQDADLEYSPSEYPILLSPILAGDADVVYGSRLMSGRPHRVLYYWHYVLNKILTRFSNILTNINLTDMETGYKVFSREILNEILPGLESKRFGFEPEFTAKVAKIAKKRKCRIYEVGISYNGRTYEEGKKINWVDGVETIYCIIKYTLFK